jgi:hypothetical protein
MKEAQPYKYNGHKNISAFCSTKFCATFTKARYWTWSLVI